MATEEIGLDETLHFRIFDASVDIGGFYVVLVFLVLAGAMNGVNLTDGPDGLAAGCSAIVLLAYTAMSFVLDANAGLAVDERQALAPLGACLVGASVGFLWFNSFPAAIFMGDTGSLGLGGAIAGMVMTKSEVLLIVIGGIFVIEALSVLAQVLTQAAAPAHPADGLIHHHFELLGVVGDKDNRALLDHGRDRERDRLHAVPAERARPRAWVADEPRPRFPSRRTWSPARPLWRFGRAGPAGRGSLSGNRGLRPRRARGGCRGGAEAWGGGRRSPPGNGWNGAFRLAAARNGRQEPRRARRCAGRRPRA